MKKILILSSLVLAFALAGTVSAVTIGNDATSRPSVDTYTDFTIIDTNNSSTGNGLITTFDYYAANTNQFRFVLVNGSGVVQWVSNEITPAGTGAQTFGPVSVSVESGWNIGLYFAQSGTVPFAYAGAPAWYEPNNAGLPIVGETLNYAGSSNRIYSFVATVSEETCTTITLVSDTSTWFVGLTETDPLGLGSFPLGIAGAAVVAGPDGFSGAWDAAAADPDVAGASWVNNISSAPGNPPVVSGDGQNGIVDVWRLFSDSFNIPLGATSISSPVLHFTSDNSVQAFLDDVSVGTAPNYAVVTDSSPLTISTGAHTFKFVTKNDAYTTGTYNPTGLIYKATVEYCVPICQPTNGGVEICDNIDNDCDSSIDEDLNRSTSNQNGLCGGNTETCVAGSWIPDGENYTPVPDDCTNVDRNCDGKVDEHACNWYCNPTDEDAGMVLDKSVPNRSIWTGGTNFLTISPKGKIDWSKTYTLASTNNCSCSQILTELQGYNPEMYGNMTGHWKYGCSQSVMNEFIRLINPNVEKVTGTWSLSINGGAYMHDMFIVTQSPSGALSGNGGYPAPGPVYSYPYNWTLTGQLTGNSIIFTVLYQNGYTATMNGNVASTWNSMGGGAGTGGVNNWAATRISY